MIRSNSLRHRITVPCLAALLAVSFLGRCVADDVPQSELQLQLQKAKIESLQQQIVQQQASAHALQQELQQRQQELKTQQQQARAEYQAAQQEYEEMQVKAARAAANDRRVAVYSLQYLQAQEAAAAISRVLNPSGSDELSVAVDERANRLIASSTAAKIKEVESLLENLDVATAQEKPSRAGKSATKMVQVRVIWLSDLTAVNDASNAAGIVDEHVLNALKPLGFSAPAVVCQTVTSVVVNDQKPNAIFVHGASHAQWDGRPVSWERSDQLEGRRPLLAQGGTRRQHRPMAEHKILAASCKVPSRHR